jgi:folate-dependent phosphoribosylglycinamide formyltransferase PurN
MSRRLVIISADGPEHRYVCNRICAEFDVAAILLTTPPERRSPLQVLKKKGVGKFVDKILWRLFMTAIRDEKRKAAEVNRVLGPSSRHFIGPTKLRRVGRPKEGELLREVQRLKPDFIAVYGTGIIPDAVLGSASERSFNMHTGISPYYRGTSCAFWPIFHKEPELVGATVHECTSKVDGGEIFHTGTARLVAGDTIHSIFAKAVQVGAEGYVSVLREAFEGTLQGMPQDLSTGREFLGSMRGFRAEVLARFRLMKMRRRWPADS